MPRRSIWRASIRHEEGRAMRSGDCRVRVMPAGVEDLGLTSELHVEELPHGLFPRLGEPFMRQWHLAHFESRYGVILVARKGDDVVGFALGTTDQHANVAWIIDRHRWKLLLSATRAFVTRPAVAALFVRTRAMHYARRLLRRSAPPLQDPDGEVVAVLEALVVTPPARRQGLGTSLVEAFTGIVAAAGTERAELVTKAGVAGAGGFYEHNGWHQVGTHVDRDGDPVLTYRIKLRSLSNR